MKVCPKCRTTKTPKSTSYCKKCTAKYHKAYYRKNKETYLKRSRASKLVILEQIRKAKAVPCVDCGGTFHFSAMDFDHVSGEKVFSLGNGPARGIKKVEEELAKCDVVCANCHRVRTWKRQRDAS